MAQTNAEPTVTIELENIHTTPPSSPVFRKSGFYSVPQRNPVIEADSSSDIHTDPENVDKQLETLKDYCEYKRELHYICNKYYEKWQYRFQIPGIIITSVSGILSFFSTSSIFSDSDIQFLTLLVGVFASTSAVLQTTSNLFDFAGKSTTHEYAVMSYDQIITKIRFMLLKQTPTTNEDIERIEQLVFELKQRCKYITPSWAEKRYNKDKLKFKESMTRLRIKDIALVKQFEEATQTQIKNNI
jgi:hypothetical protein